MAGLVALAVVAAACGSSGGSDGPRGVTDTSITIGGIAALTSASGGYPGADIGAKARFERANREGGINGRTISYIGVSDDQEAGDTNLQLVHKAVQRDKVFAIVPMLGAGFLPASSDYLNAQKVPSVGWGFMPGQCSGDKAGFAFGYNGCIQPPGATVVNTSLAKPIIDRLGAGTTVAIVSDDSANSTDGLKTVRAAFLAAGAKVVYAKANVPTTEKVDYTPFVQAVMTSDDGAPPGLVVFNSLFANTVGISAGLHTAGYKGALLNYITYSPGLLEGSADITAALQGSYVSTQFLPTEFGGDAITQLTDDIKAVDPNAKLTLGAIQSYWMADVFVQMLQAAGRDLTPERFDEVVNGSFTYQPTASQPGIGPISFPAGHGEPAPCSALVQIEGTSYQPVSPMTCTGNVPIASVPR
ncbi:ABC transporter substrate-binding protein [Frankia sp. CNm7]|uniref:ABC transporter substrate-binding protein n=1 Tax=Frankia nepalensis TaxID=1836974 RepID=A0A937RDC4_9ACTN|nr:ABC transporter substrate-binding protein [Frankia nepalensis]MBL7495581.1 ABC transporter substrate-binding protein [Frankia nepalensis]MBL7508827.1 ABC transporter substrate-binding protein [Frankia nepalensis]MBL7523954.1 ABC transporter substrate-binding protein [Frankia nepalensis]MBL7630051.1 ABC transporter substrate-binding protein [Frankia nepalensis]